MDTPQLRASVQKEEMTRFGSLRPFAGVLAIAVCGICAFVDMYCTQPLLPLFVRLFHTSKMAASLTVSATTLGVAIAAPFVGSYVERYNRKKIIVGSIFALAAPTLLAATSSGLPELVFWRFLQGILMPGIFATAIAYIAEEWAASTVAMVMAIYVSGTVLGGFLGRFLAGLIAHYSGWPWAFIALGLVNVVGGLLVALWLPHARHGGHVSGQTRADVPAEHQLRSMLRHLRNPDLLVTFGVGFNILFALVSVFTYIMFHLAAPPFNLSTSDLSLLFAVYLIGLVATPVGGSLLTRIDLRRGILGAILLSLTGVLLTLAPALWIIVTGLVFCSSGVFISQAAAISYLRQAAPPGARVSAAGLYLSCYYIGGTVAGIVPAYAWRFGGWTACVALTVAMQLFSVGLILFGWRQRNVLQPAGSA